MKLSSRTAGRLLMPVSMATILAVLAWSNGDAAQAPPQPPVPPGVVLCPGEAMPVQATGNYSPNTVSDITINGKPAPGAIWAPGHRSYWHCHAGGQIMMLDEGVGRVQKRGEKIRTLRKGDTEYAGPGVEHWHGAASDSPAQYFQTSIGNTTTLWMEEVGNADYMGNDIGLASREEFVRTKVRKKADVAIPADTRPAAPATPGQ